MRCKVRDLYPLSSSRTYTAEGFLVAPAKINRTGIQIYTARELGLDGGDTKQIRLYRSPEQVFRKETLDSFENQTATDDHPPEDINAENWYRFAKGEVTDIARGGEYTTANLIIKAADLIKKVRDGKVEISCGYSFDLDMTPGTAPDGRKYDGRQLNIEGNHVAIVDYGRAGSACRVGDRAPKGNDLMKTRITTKDHKISDKLTVPAHSITIEAEDAVVASVQDLADRHDRAMKDCKDAYDSKSAEVDLHKERADAAEKYIRDMAKEMKASGDEDDDDDDDESTDDSKKKTGDRVAKILAKSKAKDAEIARLTALTSPAEIEKLGEARAKVVGDAASLLGEDFDPKGKTIAQIHVAALDAALKDERLKGPVTAFLAGVEPSKAKAEDAARAFAGIVALGARASDDDGQDDAISRAIVGDTHVMGSFGGMPLPMSGGTPRERKLARDAEMSRRPATERGFANRNLPTE